MQIAQGAEAIIERKDGSILKKRIKKSYRHPQLDEKLRKQRTALESNLLIKARRFGLAVPRIFETSAYEIEMEYIEGKRVKELLISLSKEERIALYRQIGETTASLHEAGIVHGDLTTSNMIQKEGTLYFIDFGLAKTSSRVEDQAADLFLLYEALKAGHISILEEAWTEVLKAYKRKYPNAKQVIEQMTKIQQRRRYKSE